MASKAIGFLNFKFGADLSGFEKAMKKAQKGLKKFGKNIEKTGKSMTMGLTLPILAFGASAVKAFDEQQKAIAQVEAGLKSTGNQVGFTSEQLQKMAADLQKTTLFGDEEILKGATAQLLTFTNIAGDQFARTQEVALDLATRLDGDLKSASIMLGKALNDPVANLSALSRAGIQFSEEQKATVKAMVKTNNLAGAQTLILNELEKQYGGSAAAAAEAGMGPIQQLMNQFSDITEQIGMRLIPHIKKLVAWITGLAEKFDALSEEQKDNIVKWGLIIAAIGPVLIIIGKISIGISALIPLFGKLGKMIMANPWILLAAAVVLAAKAIYDYTTAISGAEKASKSIFDLNVKAQVQAKEEERLLKGNLEIARDKTLSDNSRKEAITVLNNKLVGLNETLNLQNIAEVNVTEAIDKHTEAMMHQAKVAGTTDLITETFNKLTKAKLSAGEAFDDLSWVEQLIQADKVIKSQIFGGKSREDAVKKQGKEISKKYVEGLTEELATLELNLKELNLEAPEGFEGIMAKLSDAGKLMGDDIITPLTGTSTAMGDLSLKVIEFKGELAEIPKILVEKKVDWVKEMASPFAAALGIMGDEIAVFLGMDVVALEEGLGSMATTLGDNLAQGAEDFKEYGIAIKGMMKDVIGALISQGVAAAVSNAMASIPPFPGSVFLIPAIAGAAAGLARTAFNSLIPAFAEGGLVTGPTTALVGEGVGTNAANPEVIAPLDKLKGMLNGGNQNVVVTGKIVGKDIWLSNEKTQFNRQRTT
mgnify:CR=1 FL=1